MPRPPLPRLPFVLLGAMTAFTVGGPVAIGLSLKGGPSPVWPPDRPVEWAVLIGTSAAVVALMAACLALFLANLASLKAARRSVAPGPESRP